jgi:hypothetical protein
MELLTPPDATTLKVRIPFFTTQASRWERVTDAFRRDWDQTKADFSQEAGHDVGQGIGDTLRQAIGAAPPQL